MLLVWTHPKLSARKMGKGANGVLCAAMAFQQPVDLGVPASGEKAWMTAVPRSPRVPMARNEPCRLSRAHRAVMSGTEPFGGFDRIRGGAIYYDCNDGP